MYGVIDIGSNTVRLVVFRREGGQSIKMINKKYSVGLVGFINDDNEMTAEGIKRLVSALTELKMAADAIALDHLFVFATASLRNVINTAETVAAVESAIGWTIEVISGDEEARYAFQGMLEELPLDAGMVADIGGGSTELVFFKDREIVQADSLPMGSLNLYNRHVEKILPRPKELKALETEVDSRLKRVSRPDGIPKGVLCCVGGSARATVNLLGGRYKNAVSGNEYEAKYIDRLVSDYAKSKSEISRLILKNDPERIHTIMPGLMVINRLAHRYRADKVITVQGGVREGYLAARIRELGEE